MILLFLASTLFMQGEDMPLPDMALVEGGTFTMGCTGEASDCMSDEKPAVQVQLGDFHISRTETTNAQFCLFLNAEGNQKEGGDLWYREDKYALIKKTAQGYVVAAGFEHYPVTNVSWYGARAFARWLRNTTKRPFRLPTEAEWEYAARGGQKSKGYRYSGSDVLEEVAWAGKLSGQSGTGWKFRNDNGIHPVGTKKANELGLFDLSGNAAEWCRDFYDNRLPGGKNPEGPTTSSYVVLRGGSWDNSFADARISARGFSYPISRFAVSKGFRVVEEVNQP